MLAKSRRAGELAFRGAPKDRVRLFVGSLEGAMLITPSYGDVSRLESAAQHLFEKLRPAAARPRSGPVQRRPARTPARQARFLAPKPRRPRPGAR